MAVMVWASMSALVVIAGRCFENDIALGIGAVMLIATCCIV